MITEEASHQKHIGIHLDKKLNFKIHIEAILIKANREISIIKKLRHTLPRKSLLTIYKAFLRPNIEKWFQLDPSIRNSGLTIHSNKNYCFSFIPLENSIIFDPDELKFLTRLRLGFTHLSEHCF